MKEITKYWCEICHTEYANKTACSKCEQSHVTAEKIVGQRHLSLSQNGKGYPVTVTIKMSDGTEQIYKRG